MSRGMGSDYLGSLSLGGGYDMGFSFDGFEEKLKKFMELPGRYLGTAVDLIEDAVAELLDAPPADVELSDRLAAHGDSETSEDLSITEPAATGAEVSSLWTSMANLEDDVCDANGSESFALKDPALAPASDDVSSEDDKTTVLVQSASPEGASIAETCKNNTSEESVSVEETKGSEEEASSCNSEDSVKQLPPETVKYEVPTSDEEAITYEEMEPLRSHKSVNSGTSSPRAENLLRKINRNEEERTVSCNSDNLVEPTEQGELIGSPDWTISENSSSDMLKTVDDLILKSDEQLLDLGIVEYDWNNDEEIDEPVVSLHPPQHKNTSLKNTVRGLMSRFQWPKKKEMSADPDVDNQSHEGEIGGQGVVVSLQNDLESGWELL